MPAHCIDLKGLRFGRLLVLGREGVSSQGSVKWRCLCDCGTKIVVDGRHLRGGTSQSCGCLARELTILRSTTHGLTKHRVYNIYRCMRARCYNINDRSYRYYGGRGIEICERWRNFPEGFIAFVEDMGLPPNNASLDRINNNGSYSPENCRWATPEEQANNKSNNINIEHDGMVMTAAQWKEEKGYKKTLIYDRLRSGWSASEAVDTPVRKIW